MEENIHDAIWGHAERRQAELMITEGVADGGVVQIPQKVDDIYTTDCWGRKKVTAKASDVLKKAGKLDGDAGFCCI
ncbi:GIP [Symbiodinium sp. CCMP2456]|nr:GIP [Symbiodinium sp. CCMP2456]